MKTSTALLASALCLGTVAAHAMSNLDYGETYPNFQPQMHSTLTRATVMNEAMAARRAGTISEGEGYNEPNPRGYSIATRQEVENDLANARKAGYVPPEGMGYTVPATRDNPR